MIPVETKPFQRINKTLVWASTLAIVCVAGYLYFFAIENSARHDVVNLTQETAILQAEESESGQIKSQLSTTDVKRSELSSYFVDANNPVPFEETIEGYGLKTNTQVSFDGLEVNQKAKTLDTGFSVEGAFVDVYRFLSLLESAPYELSITNLNMQSSGVANSTDKNARSASHWSAHISLSIHSVSGIQ